jgi:hypothetical protein
MIDFRGHRLHAYEVVRPDWIETPTVEEWGLHRAVGLMELGPPALEYEADCPKSGKYEYQNESTLHEPN